MNGTYQQISMILHNSHWWDLSGLNDWRTPAYINKREVSHFHWKIFIFLFFIIRPKKKN